VRSEACDAARAAR
jgi:hypothetical protein